MDDVNGDDVSLVEIVACNFHPSIENDQRRECCMMDGWGWRRLRQQLRALVAVMLGDGTSESEYDEFATLMVAGGVSDSVFDLV